MTNLENRIANSIINQQEADDAFTETLILLEADNIEPALEMIDYGLETTESIEQYFAFMYLKELATGAAPKVRKGILNNVYNLF